jgi:exopolysaccharide biosynthesis protein
VTIIQPDSNNTFKHTHTLAVQRGDGSIKKVVESDDSFSQSVDETVEEVFELGAELIKDGFNFIDSVLDSDSDFD